MVEIMNPEMRSLADNSIRQMLASYRAVLSDDTVSSVNHYLDQDECEMAFEGFFIDLMQARVKLKQEEIEHSYRLGKMMGLENESVFDHEFWNRFTLFLGKV